ncbi:MAG TPA: B-box zinc finger protein [Sandaracinaceae bacterium]
MEEEATGAGERCAVHADRPAAATCARCGSFMCDECRAPDLPRCCTACGTRLATGRFVAQIPAFGIALMVHGGITAATGLYYAVFGGFLALEWARVPSEPSDALPIDALFESLFFGVAALMGLVHFVPGALQMWAGWRVRTYRSRRLAILALVAGLVAGIGCYCAPTSIGMLVWGLVILMERDVRERFAAAEGSGR